MLLRRVLQGTAALVLLLDLLQVFSPLRLQSGVASYLVMAENGLAGRGWQNDIEPWLQPGYSVLLALFIKLGAGLPWIFVALNLLLLSVGIAATYLTFRNGSVCLFVLLSFVVIRHVTLAVSDICFFAIVNTGLYVVSRTERERGERFWILALSGLALAVLSTLVRSLGLALAVSWIWVISGRLTRGLARNATLAFGIAAIGGIAFSMQYGKMIPENLQASGIAAITAPLVSRVRELGEVALNLPAAKVPTPFSLVFLLAGFLLLAVIVAALWRKRGQLGAIEVFVAAYAGALLFWPWSEARFWLPLLPLMAVWIYESLRGRVVLTVYCVAFALMGFISLGYSTRITFSGDRFPELFGGGILADTYRAAYHLPPPPDPSKVDSLRLRLLQTYDPRAR